MSNPDPGQVAQQLPDQQRLVLRCLADIQKVELRDGEQFAPPFRFDLTQERLAQRPAWN